MYLQRFLDRQQTYTPAHSTDSVKNRHDGGRHDHITAVSEYRAGRRCTIICAVISAMAVRLFTKMAVVCLEIERPTRRLCSLLVALFTHRWSSSWTRFRDEAHVQYKNIVQQFSCHSKHSYLSFNGPVTSGAIQRKTTTTITKNSQSATHSKV